MTAISCLLGAAEGRDFLMHACIGVLRALNRHVERVFNPDRKDTHWESGSWRAVAKNDKEVLVRILALAILAIGTVSIGPAAAQTYDPAYPVCLHAFRGNYYECRYTSLPQCNASASGRSAQCVINPYFASAQVPSRWHRRVY